MHTPSRSRIVEHLVEGLKGKSQVEAVWLEGSDGTGHADELSDIDIVIHVQSGSEDEVLEYVEELLSELASLDMSYEESSSDPHRRYKVFHLRDTPATLLLDVNVQSGREMAEFLEENDSEVPMILFDKHNLVQTSKVDWDEWNKRLRTRLYDLENTINQRARVEKYITRNKLLEALGYYHKFILAPLIEILRIRYKPINHDYYIVSISKHLPASVIKQLEELHQVSTVEDIQSHVDVAYRWFHEVLSDIKSSFS
ncbi:hypothetical protein JCM10914A_02300 [Paenibacillus sp. JCM 10914]|uniref:nucleotidyltransferase domain-containing protein n=1 Tax=Paenibacillus sp. JCM 10914 TaxID=1236974 RepID=UPI0003CC9693|nr:nucleotidyltransferase domain-containing protein [Paenibacillus sp. JCM 10914]GAE06839.1 hypothetical protein JCM10914_3025 [Paenibacillus sp. JCM 10914]